ncbi:MAG: hypothetical protein V4605_04945 [Pseudomonadota bacterium]
MSNLTRHIHQKKINKRERFNKILEGLREPKTCQQLENMQNATRNYYTHAVRMLADAGYVICVGETIGCNPANIWQAIHFDYREHGIDYDALPDADYQPPTPITTLADPVYRHNPDNYSEAYAETARQMRAHRKSPKVHIGISSVYG